MFDWPITTEGQFQGVKLDNRMERDADIMRKKQEAAAAKKAAEEAAARAEKNKKLQVFDPLKWILSLSTVEKLMNQNNAFCFISFLLCLLSELIFAPHFFPQ